MGERSVERLDAERRRILRRAALYTYGFLVLAIVVAVGGSAFIAWIFTATGLGFLPVWLVLSAVTLGVPALGQLARALLRRDGGERPSTRTPTPGPWPKRRS